MLAILVRHCSLFCVYTVKDLIDQKLLQFGLCKKKKKKKKNRIKNGKSMKKA